MSRMSYIAVLFSILVLAACGGGGGGSSTAVGTDTDQTIASAKAIGVGQGDTHSSINPHYVARANSLVTLSGKDSDSPNPILSFNWLQIDNGAPQVELYERTKNSKAFVTPEVNETTTLVFELMVEDSKGVTGKQRMRVDVLPADDANRFLIDPATADRRLNLIASVTGGESTGAQEHTATVAFKVTAFWLDRDGAQQNLVLHEAAQSLTFPAGFSPEPGYDPLSRNENPRIGFDLMALDLDQINKHFEAEGQRNKRLDPWRIGDAYLEIELSLQPNTALDFELHALSENNALLPATELDATATETYLIKPQTGDLDALIQQDKLLAALGLESNISARNYYALIDPEGRFAKLDAWLAYAGFPPLKENVDNYPDIAHAIYLNNYDLGFGRDMYLRKDGEGNVYSYVINYPSVEAALNKTGEFAVVVMEYSDNPDPNGDNAKIVKFYSYVPDNINGGYVRTNTMNFDGRGEQAVPGVCTACHQSYTGPRQFTDVNEADLDATFMPWDADSFLYAAAKDPRYVEATIDPSQYSNGPISLDKYSRESMEEPIRQLNLGALATYKDDPERHADSIALIHGWYGDESMSLAVDALPANVFDGNYVQPGWAQQSDLYHEVFARNCRLCHVQISNDQTDFDSYEEFINNDRLMNYVFETGTMPMARLTMDRFWAPFHPGDPTAAAVLRAHLQDMGLSVSERPGLPLARFSTAPTTVTTDDTVSLDASNSLFASTFNWQMTAPSGSSSSLVSTNAAQTSFAPDIPGGEYTVTLTVADDEGQSADLTQTVSVVDRVPVAECFDADTNGLTAAGELRDIPVLARISQLGDGQLEIVELQQGSFGAAEVSEDGAHIHYTLNDPFNRGEDVIGYRLVDRNGSLSTLGNSCAGRDGYGQIRIDTRRGELAPTEVSAQVHTHYASSTVQLSWRAPEQITVEGYRIYREDQAVALADTTATSFTDTNLSHATSYRYRVSSLIEGSESQASAWASVTTADLRPQEPAVSAVSTSEIDLSWSAPATQVDTYRVYQQLDDSTRLLIGSTQATTLRINALTAGSAYTFGVSAQDDVQETDVVLAAPVMTYPEVPASLVAVSGDDARSQIALSWDAPVSGRWDGFELQRRSGTGNYSTLTQPLGTSRSYLDTGLSANTEYSYRLFAVAGELSSAPTTEVSLTTQPEDAAKPSLLTAAPHTTNDATQIALSWQLPSGFNPTELRLHRDENADGSFETMQLLAAATNSFTDSNVIPATDYTYVIEAYYAGTGAEEASEPATARTRSLQPANLQATAQTLNEITLSWVAPEAQVEGYRILRDGSQVVASHPSTQFTDTGLQPGTAYSYEVQALQNAQFAIDSAALATVPAAVSDLVVTNVSGVNSSSALQLSWSYSVDPGAWILQRRAEGEATFTEITAPAANQRSVLDTGLNPETSYVYRLIAQSNGLQSELAESAPIATAAVGEQAPQGLTIAPDVTHNATQLNLNWSMNAGYTPQSYTVLRNDVMIASDITTTSYADNNSGAWLEPDTTYSYRVVAVYGDGEASSAAVQGTTASLAVRNLNATQTTNSIDLSWDAPLATPSGYEVRRDSEAPVAQLATTFSAVRLNPGTSYSFEVRALQNGKSQVVTQNFATAPNAVAAVTVSTINGLNSDTSLQIDWTWQGGNPDSWLLQRSSDNGASFVTLTAPESSARSVIDDGLSAQTSFVYRIAAQANGITSAFTTSDIVSTTAADAGQPQSLAVVVDTTNDATQLNLSWSMNAGFNPNSFAIYRVISGADDELVAELSDASTTSYQHSDLDPGTSYRYRLLARYDNGDAEADSVVSASTRSLTVQNLRRVSYGRTNINMAWDASAANASSYQILRDGSLIVSSQTELSYSDTGLEPGTLYEYEVRAFQNGKSQSASANLPTSPNSPVLEAALNAENRTSEVDITWTYTGNGEPEWRILRQGPGETDYSLLATIPAAASPAERATNYKDSGLSSGSTYSYRMVARLYDTNSTVSNTDSETTAPISPSLSATEGSDSTTRIQLNWSYSGDGEPSWTLERALFGSSSFITVTSLPFGQTSFEDTVQPGHRYSYRVTGSLNGVNSAPSPLATEATRPLAPTNVNASVSTTSSPTSEVDVTWTQVSCSGPIEYRVNGAISDTPTSKRFDSLNHDTSYSYSVTASCNGKVSDTSSTASARTNVSYAQMYDDVLINTFNNGSANNNCASCHVIDATKTNARNVYEKLTGPMNTTCLAVQDLEQCDGDATVTEMNGANGLANIDMLWRWLSQGGLDN